MSAGSLEASPITVNSTFDVVDFVGTQQVGDLPGPDGIVSLREAIIAANNTTGSQVVGFAIPEHDPGFNGTVFTIQPLSGLPYLVDDETTIDGTTQTFISNSNPDGPEIVLDGSMAGPAAGLTIVAADNITIRGLVIHSFIGGAGIQLTSNTLVDHCYIGTDETGSVAIGNEWEGIAVTGWNSIIRDNLIVGNAIGISAKEVGVEGGGGNLIEGNLIGTDRTGTLALGSVSGIGLISTTGNIIRGNLISGNEVGISVENWIEPDKVTAGNLIEENRIGTDFTGENPLPNNFAGIVFGEFGVVSNIARWNTIAFNGVAGVLVSHGARRNTISE
jgi:hypothetical protein